MFIITHCFCVWCWLISYSLTDKCMHRESAGHADYTMIGALYKLYALLLHTKKSSFKCMRLEYKIMQILN